MATQANHRIDRTIILTYLDHLREEVSVSECSEPKLRDSFACVRVTHVEIVNIRRCKFRSFGGYVTEVYVVTGRNLWSLRMVYEVMMAFCLQDYQQA